MNFNIGGPSSFLNLSSSSCSSESSEFDEWLQDEDAAMEIEEQIALNLLAQNNYLIHHLTQQTDHVSHRRSIHGHAVIRRDRENAHSNLYNDYFSNNPVYGEREFHRRFRMSRRLFLRIVDAVTQHDNYFHQRRIASGRMGLSTLQKVTAAIRILAYGVPADATDEYIKIGESTAIECMKRFCQAIVEVFSEWYLRSPNSENVTRLLNIGQQRGFPRMLGSLDCMHWKWKNCPTAWAGKFAGRSGSPTIILEAVADYDLWIWHAYFGMPVSNNDINVLKSSNLFSKLAQGIAPPVNYVIQEKEYNMGYYLAHGIYPKWSTLVQKISNPQGPKKKLFAAKQEACRKDVERAFGVLQSKFAIIAGSSRYWKKEVLHDIMTTCIIMHNMIIEDERDINAPIRDTRSVVEATVVMVENEDTRFQQFLARNLQIKNKESHFLLRNALVEHIWEHYGNSFMD